LRVTCLYDELPDLFASTFSISEIEKKNVIKTIEFDIDSVYEKHESRLSFVHKSIYIYKIYII